MRRIKRRGDRPLLKTADPAETLRRLIEERDPVYAEADLTVESRDVPHETIVDEIVEGLRGRIAPQGAAPEGTRGAHHDRAAARRRSDHRQCRARRPRLRHRHRPRPDRDARRADRQLRPGCKVAIVTDETVARHHLAAAEAALAGAGIGVSPVEVPAGESSKSFRDASSASATS